MEYWYLFLLAMAIYAIIKLGTLFVSKGKPQIFIAVSLLILFNFQGLKYAINYEGGRSNLITGEKHYLIEEAHNYLSNRLTNEDVLLTEIITSYDLLYGNNLDPIERYSLIRVRDKNGEPTTVINLIDLYSQGWVVASLNMSLKRLNLPTNDMELNNKKLVYHGQIGEIRIWEWYEVIP